MPRDRYCAEYSNSGAWGGRGNVLGALFGPALEGIRIRTKRAPCSADSNRQAGLAIFGKVQVLLPVSLENLSVFEKLREQPRHEDEVSRLFEERQVS
jgi:hypothetical protein